MLIAEDLLLLAIEPTTGRVLHRPRREVLIAAAGALLAELTFAGAADLSGKRIVVTEPPSDRTLLGAVQRTLAEKGSGRRASSQLLQVERNNDLWARLVDSLVDQGMLGRRSDRMLWWQVTRHPVLDLVARAERVELLGAALLDPGPMSPRTAVLLALVGECGLLKVVTPPGLDRWAVRRRVREAAAASPVAGIVHKAIETTRSSD